MSTFLLQWSPPLGRIVDGYVVRKRVPGGPWLDVDAGATAATAIRVDVGAEGALDFGVAMVVRGVEDKEEDWTIKSVADVQGAAIVDIGAPPDVTGLVVAQQGSAILARWDDLDDSNIDGFEIRMGPAWESGIPIEFPTARAVAAVLGVWYSGSTKFSIAAVSKQGLYSRVPFLSTALTVAIDDCCFAETNSKNEFSDSFASGTMVGVELSGGHLRPIQFPTNGTTAWTAATTTPGWYTCERSGRYETAWVNRGALVEERIEIDPTVSIVDGGFPATQPTDDVFPVFEEDGTTLRRIGSRRFGQEVDGDGTLLHGVDLTIDIDTSPDGVPTPDGWRRWIPGATYSFWQYRLRFTFQVHWPFRYPTLTGLTHRTLGRGSTSTPAGQLLVTTKLTGTSGTHTLNAATKRFEVEQTGGGGAGGGAASAAGQGAAGGGGEGGAYCIRVYDVSITGASAWAWVNGAAGAIGTAGNHPGGNGGDSKWEKSPGSGTFWNCYGGAGGDGMAATATVGSVNGGGPSSSPDDPTTGNGRCLKRMTGTIGGFGVVQLGTTTVTPGHGGGNPMCSGAAGLITAGAGHPATADNPGSGGAGGAAINGSGNVSGGAGKAAETIVREWS